MRGTCPGYRCCRRGLSISACRSGSGAHSGGAGELPEAALRYAAIMSRHASVLALARLDVVYLPPDLARARMSLKTIRARKHDPDWITRPASRSAPRIPPDRGAPPRFSSLRQRREASLNRSCGSTTGGQQRLTPRLANDITCDRLNWNRKNMTFRGASVRAGASDLS